MERTSLSSWRTLAWGRGILLVFAGLSTILLAVVVFAPSRFDWGGGPPPWYAPGVILTFAVVGLGIVHRVVGSLRPVAADGDRVFVSQWAGEAVYPRECVHAVFVDRDRSIAGQNPIVVELMKDGVPSKVSFLLADGLDQDDLERLLGQSVFDPWDESNA